MILKAVNSSAPLDATLKYAERKASKIEAINIRHPGLACDEMKVVQLYYEKSHKRTNGKKNPIFPNFHYVISLAPGELPNVDLGELAMDISKEFVLRCEKFSGHQIELCLHEDRDHIHVHIIGNPVNRVTGKVLHVSRDEYREMIALQQQIGLEHGILPVEKGEHRRGDFVAEKQKKVEVVRRKGRDSDIVHVYQSVRRVMAVAEDWDDFERLLGEDDVSVERKTSRKHLVFSHSGRKFRDTNLSRTFTDEISKEEIEHEFELRRREREEHEHEQEYRDRIGAALEDVDLQICRTEDSMGRRNDPRERGSRTRSRTRHIS